MSAPDTGAVAQALIEEIVRFTERDNKRQALRSRLMDKAEETCDYSYADEISADHNEARVEELSYLIGMAKTLLVSLGYPPPKI